MNIVLIGMSGVGKTTVGKILAARLYRPFFDTDEMVSALHGDISTIFEIMGREKFRQWEKDAVKAGSRLKESVIATGGGVVLDGENVHCLKASGKIFLLRASAEVIAQRLSGGQKRPLLQGGGLEQIQKMMRERKETYERAADFAVDTDMMTAEEAAKSIERIWEEL